MVTPEQWIRGHFAPVAPILLAVALRQLASIRRRHLFKELFELVSDFAKPVSDSTPIVKPI